MNRFAVRGRTSFRNGRAKPDFSVDLLGTNSLKALSELSAEVGFF
jgi:hypothetical protein